MGKPFVKSMLLAALFACQVSGPAMAKHHHSDSASGADENNTASSAIWQSDLPTAVNAAKETNKDIFVDISANWCPHCRHLDSAILPNPKVVDFLTRGFVSVKVDADSRLGKKLQSGYGLSGVPDLLVFDSTGALKGKLAGAPTNAGGFIQYIQEMASGKPNDTLPTVDTFVKGRR